MSYPRSPEAGIERAAAEKNVPSLYTGLDMRDYAAAKNSMMGVDNNHSAGHAGEMQLAATMQTPMGMFVLDDKGKAFGLLHPDGSYSASVGGKILTVPGRLALPAPK